MATTFREHKRLGSRPVIGENVGMDWNALHTVSDIESLRSLAFGIIGAQRTQIESRDAEIQAHRRENHYKQTKIDALTAEIARLRRVQFAARSEAMNPEQRALFDEALTADIAAVETQIEALQPPAVPQCPADTQARATAGPSAAGGNPP